MSKVDPESFDARLSRFGGSTVRLVLPFAFELSPAACRSWRLYLSVWNSELADQFAIHYAESTARWPREIDATAHDLYAIVCAIDAQRRWGDGRGVAGTWVDDVIRQLAPMTDLWTGASLDELLAMAVRVWFRLEADSRSIEDQAMAYYALARVGRRHSLFALAKAAAEQAISAATSAARWDLVVSAHWPMASAARQRGAFKEANAVLRRALKVARSHSLRELEGATLHDAFLVALEAGDDAAAFRLADQAREAYGPDHPWLPRLAYDVGYYWLTTGYIGRAFPLIRAAAEYFTQPDELMVAWGAVARAAGALRLTAVFEFAVGRVAYLRGLSPTEHFAAQATLDIARGAAALLRWTEAEGYASEALQIASSRREAVLIFESEAVLESVRRHSHICWIRDGAETHGLSEAAALARALSEDMGDGGGHQFALLTRLDCGSW
ncbi:MAG TPA: hypothetical protein VGC13_22370 [Longimicrobium sp.]|uniref:hypothetical protein n=1 Tax=Longimicrobium sp. TaxID=2029185 RepID=UPI002ED7AB4C